MPVVYVITNLKNQKQYVGQTVKTLLERFDEHVWYALHKDGFKLHAAIRKHGVENFTIQTLEQCDENVLDFREIYWIESLGTFRNGYNLTPGGRSAGLRVFHEKPVTQFTLDGQKITTFRSMIDASRATGVNYGSIKGCCRGVYKTAGKYIWRFVDSPSDVKPRFSKVIKQSLDGTPLEEFSSHFEAAKTGAFNANHILACCKGRTKTHRGFRWSFKIEENSLPTCV